MIFLGKIVKTRGNKGEVVLHSSPYFESYTPEKGEVVVLRSQKYEVYSTIEDVKDIQGIYAIKFQSIDSITNALKYVGYSLFSQKEPDESLSDDTILDFSVSDISGATWGHVQSHDFFGMNEILEVRENTGETIYIPVTDSIIKKIDYEKKEIIIDPPDGLKDLNKP